MGAVKQKLTHLLVATMGPGCEFVALVVVAVVVVVAVRPASGAACRQPAVEDWVYVNLTGDTHPMHTHPMHTHPMHTHLFTHQVIGRTPFNVAAYMAAAGTGSGGTPGGLDPTPFATGPMQPPAPEERGFKDTTKANPGFFTTIRGRFELPAGVTAHRPTCATATSSSTRTTT